MVLDGMISDYRAGAPLDSLGLFVSGIGRALSGSIANAFLPSQVGMSPVGTLFVIGEHSAAVLRNQGTKAREIVASGLPRWPDVPLDRSRPQAVAKVLYLTGAFDWHGDKASGSAQVRDVTLLADECRQVGLDLSIRVHPRDIASRYAGAGKLILAEDESAYESILKNDLVVSIVSTGLLEAITLGRAARVLCMEPNWSRFSRSFAADPIFEPIREVQALRLALSSYRYRLPAELYDSQRSGAKQFVAAGGTDALARIVHELVAAG